MNWPKDDKLNLGVVKSNQSLNIKMLGYNTNLNWKQTTSGIQIEFSKVPFIQLPSQVAWVLKFENK